jgi:hypothetical protein
MAKIGSVKWHEEKIAEIKSKKAEAGKIGSKARNDKHFNFKDGYGNTLKTPRKKPKPRYRSRVEYDFLKYIRIIFKWATDNYPELNRPKIEFLLYLYSLGAFSRKQFDDFHKTVGLYSVKTLKGFEEGGWITTWRTKKGKSHALYVLTHKAKLMCNKMHKFAAGTEEIPMNELSNAMMKEGTPRINRYYLEIIKKMNKDRAPDK